MKEKKEQMSEEKEPAVPQDFLMEAEKQPEISNDKPGFEDLSVKAEKIKFEIEGGTAILPPRSAGDIPRTPLSERFSKEE